MQDTIWTALIILIALVAIGLREWQHTHGKQRTRHEQKQADIEFERCSKEEFVAKVKELQESMRGKG